MFSLPRQVWFALGCRAVCVRKSIRPLVLISPTYITLQINDTVQEGRSIGDKVKVSPLPVHRVQGWDGGWGRGGADKTKQVYSFVFCPHSIPGERHMKSHSVAWMCCTMGEGQVIVIESYSLALLGWNCILYSLRSLVLLWGVWLQTVTRHQGRAGRWGRKINNKINKW